jgi:hypothetical protein
MTANLAIPAGNSPIGPVVWVVGLLIVVIIGLIVLARLQRREEISDQDDSPTDRGQE